MYSPFFRTPVDTTEGDWKASGVLGVRSFRRDISERREQIVDSNSETEGGGARGERFAPLNYIRRRTCVLTFLLCFP